MSASIWIINLVVLGEGFGETWVTYRVGNATQMRPGTLANA